MTQINTRAAHTAAVARMSDLSAQLDVVQGQIATGRRVTLPSDDPVAFTRAAVLHRAQAASDASQRSIDAGARRLTATDTALEGISNLVQRARELALQGANGTLSADDRGIIATELREIQASFVSLADSRGSDGERLFGGAAADRPAYAADSNGVIRWSGAGKAPPVPLGDTSVASGVEGPDAFGTTDPATNREDIFATLANLSKALAEPDPDLRDAAMAASIGQIDGHVTRLADSRAAAGARLARLETESERLSKGKLATETDLSKLESLDLTEAIPRLQRLMVVLQATQASFAKLTSLSLWDSLR